MSTEDVVERWARWSRAKCASWAEEAGPLVTVNHDSALQRTNDRLKHIGMDEPDESCLFGAIFAFDFLSGDSDVDPVAKNHLLRKLALQIGLVAEAASNQVSRREFDRIVFGVLPGRQEPSGKSGTDGGEIVDMTGTYSCNARGEVWPSTAKGWNPEETREYLQGTDPALDAIVKKVLAVSPMGGRFEVTGDGVFLARDLSQVA